ncbi:MAG: MerR family transcriptional regulator [Dehalococcoidales bacterium]|nr:MerR family transcriptional regulator [Dehalococcoidales bacterium]
MAYTVKKVAALASLSVRALHHYDHIGLLKPASVSPAGYRLYTEADLERLQQILFFRELGFGLAEIKRIMNSPGYDRKAALREHRRLLLEKRQRLDKLIQSVERTIESLEGGSKVSEKEMFAGFDQKQIDAWTEEARERWGSEHVDESLRRTAHYGKADWEALLAEMGDLTKTIADNMERGPADPAVQEQVGRWYRLINERFYECSPEMFRGLGDLYVDDPRFTATYEKVRPGLAAFMREAMHYYSDHLAAEA